MNVTRRKLIGLAAISLLISSCGAGQNNGTTLEVGHDVSLLDNVELNYEKAFFDDFSGGVSNDDWYIGKQAWGGRNGGVVPENVHYTDDGVLVLSGNGKYYNDGDIKGVGEIKDGRYTGGALISKFLVSSGRFEVKMKVLPRLGACTAFWTFAYNNDDGSNHEIDIELPGGNRTSMITFANVLNTNYITEQRHQSQDTKVSSILGGDDEVYLNDGEWHTFGFDWYTNPEKVVYYIDGKICAISDVFVPNLKSRLWLGVWFPVTSAFVGSADFESDDMLVDYVKYIPFKNQPSIAFEPLVMGTALDSEYPKEPIALNAKNKASNGTFEKLNFADNNTGAWTFTKYLNEDKELAEVVDIANGVGQDESQAAVIKDGGVVYQNIDAVYKGFKHNLSFKAHGQGKVTIRYYGATTTEVLKTEVITIDNQELSIFNRELTAPNNSQSLRITIDSSQGNQIIVDDVTLYQI